MASSEHTIHEVDFCGQIATEVSKLAQHDPSIAPIYEARIEGFGKDAARRKRKDLRFFNKQGMIILCGEVKLPGTLEGRSPYDAEFCKDAAQKADNAGVRFFFTWNVNTFVLWDRSLWDRPLLDRRIREWRLDRTLRNHEEVSQEDNLKYIKTNFMPILMRDVADIIAERRRDWSLPPDDIFIRSLESHLDWPIHLVSSYILEHVDRNKNFASRVEQWMTEQDWTFVRTPRQDWIKAVDNMAKTLAYIWINRLIFYKALRARFSDLPRLDLRASVKRAEEAIAVFNRFFQRAVERSGDYEPLLMPEAKDWATSLVFEPTNALDAWRGLLRGIDPVDFSEVSSDVVGRIFQKLIGPEERHRYGQHFTGDDVVDLINGFCIHEATDAVLDPACGSGSFLVRAYYRKRVLNPRRSHLDFISELFGCDIALYPTHLATLNLAAREINEEANYPRIKRRNFFDFSPGMPFCFIPTDTGENKAVAIPALDVVVGNPPYVRQEKIEKTDKTRFSQLVSAAWPDLSLTGRSDLHCYFWPAAARLLKADGYFGFLTSSSWLDVEYGFALQGWLLRHFRILAVMESAAEPWFEDARVKTCITILQRCDDEAKRMTNLVRFVRFNRKLADVIGVPPGHDEDARQAAIDRLRNQILKTDADFLDQDLRIIVKTQQDLWADGVRAASILGGSGEIEFSEESEDDTGADEDTNKPAGNADKQKSLDWSGVYKAGKWGRYLRAPDFYFDIMRRFGSRFVALGEIAQVRFGVKSGCDAFFMPKDITQKMLAERPTDRAFREHAGGAPRKDVESGKLKIIKAGDGSIHPIEAEYLKPELHSLMKVDRPIVRAADLDRVVLMVCEPMDKLKAKAPWAWRYLRYGEKATFTSSKSKSVPVPKRSTVAGRDPWYDLTRLVCPGIAFWPKAQQYRHIIPMNRESIIGNCNLYDVASEKLKNVEKNALVAILNSTLIGFFKTFYGRFAGTEGNLKTEVVDVNLMEVPDPRGVSRKVAKRLADALESMNKRDVGRLIEEQLMDCHEPGRARQIAAGPLVLANELKQTDRRDLDDAVFELLGVSDFKERKSLIDRLYDATARHFRDIRVVEIEKMEQRAKSDCRKLNVDDLAADIWDASELEDTTPLRDWISHQLESDSEIIIPEERSALFPENPLFELKTISFGKENKIIRDYQSREQAELVFRLANLGISGKVKLPSDRDSCIKLLESFVKRMDKACARFKELAESRTSDDRIQTQLIEVLERWFALGKEPVGTGHETPESK